MFKNYKTREERALEQKLQLEASGLRVSDKYMTIRYYLGMLISQNKISKDFITSGRITSISVLAKKLCIKDNWHYIKSSKLRYSHNKQIACYPIEVLDFIFSEEFKNINIIR
jgi:hypothetical protein